MATKDALGDRIKSYYEDRYRFYLTRRVPVFIRLDGKAFHTLTAKLHKPYDEIFHNTMNATMKYLCENIQGCKFGYTQSDEITLILTDYDTLTTDAWFDYNIQKMCSVAASMATFAFNRFFRTFINEALAGTTMGDYGVALCRARDKGGMFDARCFNVPKEDCGNAILWRQNDCTKNAVQMLGRCYFSDKELHGKHTDEIQDMLMTQKGVNFNECPIDFKRGACCYRVPTQIDSPNGPVIRNKWAIDLEMPILTQSPRFVDMIINS